MSLKRLLPALTLFLVSTLTTLTLLSLSPSPPLLSPVSQLLSPLSQKLGLAQVPRPQKIIFGFLPFWNLKYNAHFHYHLLTHLAYFGLDFNPDGTPKKLTDATTLEPGWHQLHSQTTSQVLRKAKTSGVKTILVLRIMTNDTIESLVNQPVHRQQFISSTLQTMTTKNFDGLNIDFEYVGSPDPDTKQNFTLLVQELSQACKNLQPDCEISLDVFADAATKNRLWDFSQLTPAIDYLIIMAYDFYRPSSTQAGPVAPLRGTCTNTAPALGKSTLQQSPCLEYDVSTTVADFSKLIPLEKILLGVPYYGYQWQTASPNFLANTYPQSGSLASFNRIQTLLHPPTNLQNPPDLSILGLHTQWNDFTQTPWLSFTDSQGQIQQIHYEDERSLGLKYDLVNQSNLAGIAIWALGYDGSYPQLWQLLQNKFFK